MRKFARSHWKIIIAILLAVVLATLTLETDSAPASGTGPDLSVRLRTHVEAIASTRHGSAARHIETMLQGYGYAPRSHEYKAGGQQVRNIEVSVSNTAPGARPERIFIVGAKDNGSGTAAVLELARLLKTMQPGRGTEVKFVFLVDEEAAWLSGDEMGSGNFIAFVGTLESSALVRQALAAFKAGPDFPAEGLAAPAHAMGVTLSDHSAYNRHGYPALMLTDTAFLRYPYYHTLDDTPDKPDYAGMARVVKGLARTIESLAGAAQI